MRYIYQDYYGYPVSSESLNSIKTAEAVKCYVWFEIVTMINHGVCSSFFELAPQFIVVKTSKIDR